MKYSIKNQEKCNIAKDGFCGTHLRFHKKLKARTFKVDYITKPRKNTHVYIGCRFVVGNKLFEYISTNYYKLVYSLRTGDRVIAHPASGRWLERMVIGVKLTK